MNIIFLFFKSNCYRNTNLKKRYHFAAALKSSNMRLSQVRRYGFNVCGQLWRNCINGRVRKKGLKLKKLRFKAINYIFYKILY